MRSISVARLVLAAAILVPLGAVAQSPQAQADAAVSKFDRVMRPPAAKSARRTVFSQSELNAYLRYKASWLPQGISDATVGFLDANHVSTSVVADLDHVRQRSSGGWFDPTAYLKGKLPVFVSGTLTTGGGRWLGALPFGSGMTLSLPDGASPIRGGPAVGGGGVGGAKGSRAGGRSLPVRLPSTDRSRRIKKNATRPIRMIQIQWNMGKPSGLIRS